MRQIWIIVFGNVARIIVFLFIFKNGTEEIEQIIRLNEFSPRTMLLVVVGILLILFISKLINKADDAYWERNK